MKRTEIHIATTEGPSAIQRITAEDSDVRSVVCLAGKAISLPISADYDAFVRRPTGVVEACFGHNSYRVDISHPIANGLSWQLGLFAAHALIDAKIFAAPGEGAAQALWVSGEVRRDLEVESVADVELKIRQSSALFSDLLARNIKLTIAVPTGNVDEARAALMAQFGADVGGIRLVAADNVSDVLTAIGLKGRRTWRKWLARSQTAMDRKPPYRSVLYGASAALSLALLISGWHSVDAPVRLDTAQKNVIRLLPASWRPAPAHSLRAIAIESRPPADKPCAAVHLDAAVPHTIERAVQTQGATPSIRSSELCDFRYRIINKANHNSLIWVMATRASATGSHFRLRNLHEAKMLAAQGTLDLDARPPRTVSAALKQEFVLLTVAANKAAKSDFSGLMGRARRAKSAADLTPLLDEARKQGATVMRLSQEFTP